VETDDGGNRTIGLSASLSYGAGSIAFGVFLIVPQLLLLFFMTEVLAIPPAVAGIALLIPKGLELVVDPLIGRWSDATQTRWGRRRPFMAVGSVVFFIAFSLLFAPPVQSTWQVSLVWMVALYTLCTCAYTFFELPYVTMLSEMTDSARERTRLAGWRSAFLSVGIILAGVLAQPMVRMGGDSRMAYAIMGATMAAIAFCSMLVTVAGTASCPQTRRTGTARRSVFTPFKSAAFRWLLATFCLQMLSVSLNTVTLAYYNKYWLGNGETTIGLIFLGSMVLTIATTPLWTALARRIGKYPGFMVASICYALGTATFWFAKEGPAGLGLTILCFGIANGGQQLFTFALVPDVIAAERARSGVAEEGAFMAMWTVGAKISIALGSGLVGVLLALAGFREGGDLAAQSPGALTAILGLVSIAPALVCLASVLTLLKAHRAMQRLTVARLQDTPALAPL
jgi:Na+/melibiose symporter-like transporter